MANGGRIGGRNVPGVDGYSGIWTPNEIADAARKGVWPQGTYAQVVAADSPRAWWKLDETSGTSAADSAGSNTGTYAGATLNQSPLITTGKSGLFSGSSSGISVPHSTTLNFISTGFSLECWVKTTQASIARLFDKSTSGTNFPEYWMFMNANGTITAEVRSSNADTPKVAATTVMAVNDGTRHHTVAAFVPSGTLKIYIDNALAASVSHAIASSYNNGSPLYIGRRSNFADCLNGSLDEVAVYGSALSPERVAAHYTAGTFA